jgi:hypothetical protein
LKVLLPGVRIARFHPRLLDRRGPGTRGQHEACRQADQHDYLHRISLKWSIGNASLAEPLAIYRFTLVKTDAR